ADGAGEFGTLGKKSVAGMNRVGAGGTRGLDDRRDIEIAPARLGRTDEVRLVGCGDVRGVGVGFRIDRDGGEPEQARAANYPERYFATIGNEQFAEGAALHSARERSTWRARRRARRGALRRTRGPRPRSGSAAEK